MRIYRDQFPSQKLGNFSQKKKKKKRFRQAIILVSPSWLPNLYLAVWFYAYGNRFHMFGILYESCGFVEFQFCTIPHKA